MSAERQAIVVSFAADSAISPRVQRTAHLIGALERHFDFRVERVPRRAVDPSRAAAPWRIARRALRPLALDSFEVPARLALRGWQPSGVGALLIAWPYSPIYVAASRLVAAGIPYVVDVGDPWALTEPVPTHWSRRLAVRRAMTAESFLWRHAAAGVVTTEAQASGLRALFPDLDLLCRPNGYATAGGDERHSQPTRPLRSDSEGELRLVQFGSVNPVKLPLGGWLSMVRSAAGLRSVRFASYGPVDRPELLQSEDPAVMVEVHEPVKWDRACEIARSFDAAVVVANLNPAELPSRSIQYLTLPIPRVAVTASREPGELGAFAARRPGFVAVKVGSREDVPRLIAHLRRGWPGKALKPPAEDSWDEVALRIARFAIEAWDRQRPQSGRGHLESSAALRAS